MIPKKGKESGQKQVRQGEAKNTRMRSVGCQGIPTDSLCYLLPLCLSSLPEDAGRSAAFAASGLTQHPLSPLCGRGIIDYAQLHRPRCPSTGLPSALASEWLAIARGRSLVSFSPASAKESGADPLTLQWQKEQAFM